MPHQVVTNPDNAPLTYLLLPDEDVTVGSDQWLDLGLVGGFVMGPVPCFSIGQEGREIYGVWFYFRIGLQTFPGDYGVHEFCIVQVVEGTFQVT